MGPREGTVATIAEEIVASRARNKILGFLCDWEFQSSRDKEQVRKIIRQVRLRSGEQLAHWQVVMDARDWAALVEFFAGPNVLAMGPELISRWDETSWLPADCRPDWTCFVVPWSDTRRTSGSTLT